MPATAACIAAPAGGDGLKNSHSPIQRTRLHALRAAVSSVIVHTHGSSLPKELPAENVAMFLETIYMLMERRRKHFQNIPRIVIKYEVLETEKGWDLNVTSVTVAPKEE